MNPAVNASIINVFMSFTIRGPSSRQFGTGVFPRRGVRLAGGVGIFGIIWIFRLVRVFRNVGFLRLGYAEKHLDSFHVDVVDYGINYCNRIYKVCGVCKAAYGVDIECAAFFRGEIRLGGVADVDYVVECGIVEPLQLIVVMDAERGLVAVVSEREVERLHALPAVY